MLAKLTFIIEEVDADPTYLRELCEEFLDLEPSEEISEDVVHDALRALWDNSRERFMKEFGTDLEVDYFEVES